MLPAALILRRVLPPPPQLTSVRPASALDATATRSPDFQTDEAEKEERVFCGAMTKRGTPCRRLVRPGERCAQHRLSRPSSPLKSLKSLKALKD